MGPYAARNVGRESWRHRVRKPRGVVVLASGGLDSCALIAHNVGKGRDVFPLFIRCGLRWERAELGALKRWLRSLGKQRALGKRRGPAKGKRGRKPGRVMRLSVLSVPADDLYGRHWSTSGEKPPGWRAADNSVYLPGRNILLLSKAAVFAAMQGIPRLAVGQLRGNTFPDATPGFFRLYARGLSAGLDFHIRIEAPFLRTDKHVLIARYRDLPLHLTLSCSAPRGGEPCGRCAKCRERALAFKRVGLPDGMARAAVRRP